MVFGIGQRRRAGGAPVARPASGTAPSSSDRGCRVCEPVVREAAADQRHPGPTRRSRSPAGRRWRGSPIQPSRGEEGPAPSARGDAPGRPSEPRSARCRSSAGLRQGRGRRGSAARSTDCTSVTSRQRSTSLTVTCFCACAAATGSRARFRALGHGRLLRVGRRAAEGGARRHGAASDARLIREVQTLAVGQGAAAQSDAVLEHPERMSWCPARRIGPAQTLPRYR